MNENPYEYSPAPIEEEQTSFDAQSKVSRINFVTNNGFVGDEEQKLEVSEAKKPRVLFQNVKSKPMSHYYF